MLLINLTSTLASINPNISTFYREDEPNTMDLTIIHVVDKSNNGISSYLQKVVMIIELQWNR